MGVKLNQKDGKERKEKATAWAESKARKAGQCKTELSQHPEIL